MSCTKTFLRASVVIAALLVSLPALALAQTTSDPGACKRTYRTCVSGKQISDTAAKAQCAQTYKECLGSARDAAKAGAKASAPTTSPTTKTQP